MGTALVQAVSYRDYPTVQAIIFVMALVFLMRQPGGRPALRVARPAHPVRVMARALGRLVVRQPLGAAGARGRAALMIVVAVFAPALAPHGPKDAGVRAVRAARRASFRWAPTSSAATC